MSYFWNTLGKNAGQIVERSEAQKSGAAEGTQGKAKGLERIIDRSDQTWEILHNGKVIANGKGQPYPTVEDAMRIRDAK